MKILILSDDFPPESFGGAGISTYEIGKELIVQGHEVWVMTTTQKGTEMETEVYEGMHVYRVPSNYHERWRAWKGLVNPHVLRILWCVLREVRPNIIHANNIHYHISYVALLLALWYGKVVFTARDAMTFSYGKLFTEKYRLTQDAHLTGIDHIRQAGKRYNPFRNIFIRICLSLVHARTAVSEALQKALKENGITNVTAIHTGLKVADWEVNPREVDTFREKYQLHQKKVVFFGGRLSEAKGGLAILSVLKKVKEKVPNVVLLVVGSVELYEKYYKTRTQELNLDESIVVTGWIPHNYIKYAIAASDIAVVPSIIFDAFPRVVLEAMIQRKPVIGTCFGGAKEAIEHGCTGYIVNPFELENMTKYTTVLLTDPVLARRFGEAGYVRIRSKFTIEHTVRAYEMVYGLKSKEQRS